MRSERGVEFRRRGAAYYHRCKRRFDHLLKSNNAAEQPPWRICFARLEMDIFSVLPGIESTYRCSDCQIVFTEQEINSGRKLQALEDDEGKWTFEHLEVEGDSSRQTDQ